MKRTKNETDRSANTVSAQSPLARVGLTGADAPPPHDTNVPVLLLGGRRDCHVTVAHGDVSQIHAAIINTGRALVLIDLASRTGTFVNESKINVATLRPGDRVRLGPVPLSIQFKYPPAAGGDPTRLPKPFVLRWKDEEFRLNTLPAVIGRRQACDVLIDTPDISLAHALLLTIDDCPAVMDLGSRSGTFVNGERISLSWLRGGDDLRIGGEQLATVWTGPTAPATLPVPKDKSAPANVPAAAEPVEQARPIEAAPAPIQPPAPIEIPAPALSPPPPVLVFSPAPPSAAESSPPGALEACIAGIEQHVFMLRGLLATRDEAVSRKMAEADARLTQLNAEREQHAARFTQIAAREQTLAERDRQFAERDHQLAARDGQLAARERDLARRESATADAARKLEEIRTALDQASRGLSGIDAVNARAPHAAATPLSAPSQAHRPARADPPAPLVDRPIFGGVKGSPSSFGV